MGLFASVMPSVRQSDQPSPPTRAPDTAQAPAPRPALWTDSPRSAASTGAGRVGVIGAEFAPAGWGQPIAVTRLDPGGPALASGMVAPGDLLLEVDGRDVRGAPQRAAEELLAGAPGSVVTLTLQRGSHNLARRVPA